MIDYIKEYGVTSIDFDYIMKNQNKEIIELIALSENSVRDILEFYNSIGVTKDIAKIILFRPDLILIPKESLVESISKIDRKIFVSVISESIEDLIVLGI